MKVQFLVTGALVCFVAAQSFILRPGGEAVPDEGLPGKAETSGMLPRLSDYALFQGPLADLIPAAGCQVYELATPLFTDYAEKQRLIKVPAGSRLKVIDDGLPAFPEGQCSMAGWGRHPASYALCRAFSK